VERAREAEHGKSSARCQEEENAERQSEKKLQHEIEIDSFSEVYKSRLHLTIRA
jgi:hypothetical protein